MLLVGVPIAFQLFLLAFLLHLQNTAEEADRWAIHTKEVIAQAEEAYRLLTESVSQMRGMVITGDPNFSPELAQAAGDVRPAMERLQALVADNPPQLERARQFGGSASNVLTGLAAQRERVRSGHVQEAAARVISMEGERSVARLRGQLEVILAEEQRLDHLRMDRLAAARRQGYWFIGSAAALTVALAAAALALFARGVAARLATLAENAARLADRRELAQSVDGGDEIGSVDRAFRAAAARLAEAKAAEQRLRDEQEARAAELAAANAELARTNEDLRFKTQENETFVYSVSHDLRSPLVNLQGFGKELSHACVALRLAAESSGVPAETRAACWT